MVYKKQIVKRNCQIKKVQKQSLYHQLVRELCSDGEKVRIILQQLFEKIETSETIDLDEIIIKDYSRRSSTRRDQILNDIFHLCLKHDFPHDVTCGFADFMQRKRTGNIKIVLVISTNDEALTENEKIY